MSQYFQLMVGDFHEEDYTGWLNLCKGLAKMGVLNDAEVVECHQIGVGDGTTQWQILEAVRKGDPHPERYIPRSD